MARVGVVAAQWLLWELMGSSDSTLPPHRDGSKCTKVLVFLRPSRHPADPAPLVTCHFAPPSPLGGHPQNPTRTKHEAGVCGPPQREALCTGPRGRGEPARTPTTTKLSCRHRRCVPTEGNTEESRSVQGSSLGAAVSGNSGGSDRVEPGAYWGALWPPPLPASCLQVPERPGVPSRFQRHQGESPLLQGRLWNSCHLVLNTISEQ